MTLMDEQQAGTCSIQPRPMAYLCGCRQASAGSGHDSLRPPRFPCRLPVRVNRDQPSCSDSSWRERSFNKKKLRRAKREEKMSYLGVGPEFLPNLERASTLSGRRCGGSTEEPLSDSAMSWRRSEITKKHREAAPRLRHHGFSADELTHVLS